MALIDSFFESSSSGAFSLNDLSLSLRHIPPAEGFESLRGIGDEPQRMNAWLAATAYFHEMRHYHDLIGTPSGLGLFLETTRLIDKVLVAMRDSAGGNLLPLQRRQPDAPAAKLYRLHHSVLAALLGENARLSTPEESASQKLIVDEFDFPEIGLDFAVPLVPIPRFNQLTGEREERQVPLGLRALLEHTATEIQLFTAAIGAGDDPYTTEDFAGRGRRFLEMFQELVRGDRTPYYALRLLGQYHLHGSKPRVAGFDTLPKLGSLMATTQAALDIGGYAPVQGEGWKYEHPGLAFAHLLTFWHNDFESFDTEIDAVDTAVSKLIGRGWRDFLGHYVKRLEHDLHGTIPPFLRPDAAEMPLIGELRRSVLEAHLAIMRSKAASLRPWADPVAYVSHIKDLPPPPLLLASGFRVGVSSSRQGAYFLLWSTLLGIVENAMDTGPFDCTIRRRMGPAMDFFSFADPDAPGQETSCHRFVERQLCGDFSGHFRSGQPPLCPFARLVNVLRHECGIEFFFEEVKP
jgi:hypothetical protein